MNDGKGQEKKMRLSSYISQRLAIYINPIDHSENNGFLPWSKRKFIVTLQKCMASVFKSAYRYASHGKRRGEHFRVFLCRLYISWNRLRQIRKSSTRATSIYILRLICEWNKIMHFKFQIYENDNSLILLIPD